MIEALERFIHDAVQAETLTTRVADDVRKRLRLLYEALRADTLSAPVRAGMSRLITGTFLGRGRAKGLGPSCAARAQPRVGGYRGCSEAPLTPCVCVPSPPALSQGRVERGNEEHLALMLEHVGEVKRWMVGVKKIIHAMQTSATT